MTPAKAQALRRCAVLLAIAAVWMAIDLPAFPIARWDESRLAVNAIEMRTTGWSLITTYGFRPDLWNTKPPLLIWLMNACMAVFGPSEGALRIPSALATLGSAAMVMGFTWKITRSSFAPPVAGLLLLTTRGFVNRHSGQTADYEALLCFFVTAYSLQFFRVLHRRRPRPAEVLLAFMLVAGAVLTKGVAGLPAGAGLVLYLLVQRRIWRPLQSWAYPLCALAATALVAAFYLARERAAPGYLHAVAINELGRYGAEIGGHHNPVWYYVLLVFGAFGFSIGVFALPLLAQVRHLGGRRRAGMVFALCMAFGILLAFSAGKTKIRWYAAPCYPFLAIGCAIGLESVRDRLRQRRGEPVDAPAPKWERLALRGVGAVLVLLILIERDVYPSFFDTPIERALRRGFRRPATGVGSTASRCETTGCPTSRGRPSMRRSCSSTRCSGASGAWWSSAAPRMRRSRQGWSSPPATRRWNPPWRALGPISSAPPAASPCVRRWQTAKDRTPIPRLIHAQTVAFTSS